MQYAVEFRDHDGSIFATAKVSADTDEQATAQAEMLLKCGLGDCCEVRHDRDAEQLLQDEQKPQGLWALVHKCIELALKTRNLQQRRFLMLLTENFLERSPACRKPDLPLYKVVLIAADDMPIAAIELESKDDREAFGMASILAEVCLAKCARFELWHDRVLRSAGIRPFLKLSPADLPERLQRQVVAGEVALHEVCKTAAESRALLNKVDSWLAGVTSA